jgi:DNA-binding transcriptional MocR family regulator
MTTAGRIVELRRYRISVQAAGALREAILSKTLGPGDQLPSGTELAKRDGVARMTVQQRFARSETKGWSSRDKAVGCSFDAGRPSRTIAMELLELIRAANMSVPPCIEDTADPLEVLRHVATVDATLTARVERTLLLAPLTRKRLLCRRFVDSGGGIRTRDLRVMSPTSYQTAPPRGVDRPS